MMATGKLLKSKRRRRTSFSQDRRESEWVTPHQPARQGSLSTYSQRSLWKFHQ